MESFRLIGERIRLARRRKGLTQTELADLSKHHLQTIARWERGERSPVAESLERISEALGVRSGWIISGEGPMELPTPAQEGAPSKFRLETTTLRRLEAPVHQLAADEILSETDYLLNSLAGLSESEVPTFMRAWRQAKEEARRAREIAKQADTKRQD